MNLPAARLSLLLLVACCCAGCWRGSPSVKKSQPSSSDRSRPDVSQLHTGPQLYQALCAACHGNRGAADGPGAQSLYPPPRNLRQHSFRLVSTDNGVPTRSDIDRVISRGMPGTSMRAFSELSAAQRELLVDEVLRMRREGAEELVRRMLRTSEEAVSDDDVRDQVARRTTAGAVVAAPPRMPADKTAIARGRKLYVRQACQACHGDDGRGAADVRLLTSEGVPTRGRDLVYEPFKGGSSPESMFLRISLGMPGTPMPASRTLTPEEAADLVAYCRSLSREPKRELTNHQRRQLATAGAYLQAFETSK